MEIADNEPRKRGVILAHKLSDRKDDLYETPSEATRALLKHEVLPQKVWEPACGRGAISHVLLSNGHAVYSSDLVDYGYGDHGIDFLMWFAPVDAGAIVTNPPFKLAADFVRKALDLGVRKTIMLLRLSFLEGTGRSDIMDCGRLARVHVFRNRLPMMHRDGWQGPRTTSTVAYAWFVWELDNKLPTIINRITW